MPARRFALLIALLALAVLPAGRAAAAPIGYLYSGEGPGIDEFSVAADNSLTYLGVVPGGPASLETPSTMDMAKTTEGESLYQLAGTPGGTQTIHQYTVDTETGALTAKSPASVGSIPLIDSDEQHAMAVFDPAAHGESGQAALYVISGHEFEQAIVFIFDIDPVTGALTEAGAVDVPGVDFSADIHISGDVLVTDSGKIFQRATIDPSTAGIEFESLPDDICSETDCGDGVWLLDTEHMLTGQLIPTTNEHGAEVYVAGFGAYGVGGAWNAFTAFWGASKSGGFITGNEHEYLVVEREDVQAYAPTGEPESFAPLATSASWFPAGDFWFDHGLYIPVLSATSLSPIRGFIYHYPGPGETPVVTESAIPMGIAMAAFEVGAGGTGTGSGGSGGTGAGSGGSGGGSPPPPVPIPVSSGAKASTAAIPPPKTKIEGVTSSAAKTTIKFSGSGGVGKLTFRCRFAPAKKSTACSSPLVEHHLAAGDHHFYVDAVDSRGVDDPTPAHTTFTTR